MTADPHAKVMRTRALARDWAGGRLAWGFDPAPLPARPAQPERPALLPPAHMPRRGRAGSPATRIAMLHALAHIEFTAIDLAVDLVARFGGLFPRAFSDEWVRVAAEEAMHFALVERRLRTLGARYGDLPAHDGLWQAAEETAGDALARLAVVPMVLEARGLDVTPAMIERFRAAGDTATTRILQRILTDEERHVAAGVRWFQHLCAAQRFDPADAWHRLVAQHFRGTLKPPFNDSARSRAGLTPDYYAQVALARQG